MIVSRTVSVALVAATTALVIACGGGDATGGATFTSGDGTATGDPNATSGNGSSDGEFAPGGGTGSGTGTGNGTGSGTSSGTSTPACAAVNAKAEQIPVYLVVMFDKSGSMDKNGKWAACSSGLKTFFADPKSAGMSASLQFFPLGATEEEACTTAPYGTPRVLMTSLPNATLFKQKIDAMSPSGNTPTLPALQSAIAYAKQIRTTVAAQTQGKVAVVLVSDGDPAGCDDNSDESLVSAAAAARAEVPTYTIGVGNIPALTKIAQAGGTTKAFEVSATDPAKTATEFQAALATIRGAALSCEYKMPEPPQGKTLDLAAVNVVYTSGAGKADTLAYSKDCAAGGWRYDNPAAPSKIVLCPTSCTTIKSDSSPKVAIELGCETKGTNGSIPR